MVPVGDGDTLHQDGDGLHPLHLTQGEGDAVVGHGEVGPGQSPVVLREVHLTHSIGERGGGHLVDPVGEGRAQPGADRAGEQTLHQTVEHVGILGETAGLPQHGGSLDGVGDLSVGEGSGKVDLIGAAVSRLVRRAAAEQQEEHAEHAQNTSSHRRAPPSSLQRGKAT